MSYGKRVSASSASLCGGSGALLLDPTGGYAPNGVQVRGSGSQGRSPLKLPVAFEELSSHPLVLAFA